MLASSLSFPAAVTQPVPVSPIQNDRKRLSEFDLFLNDSSCLSRIQITSTDGRSTPKRLADSLRCNAWEFDNSYVRDLSFINFNGTPQNVAGKFGKIKIVTDLNANKSFVVKCSNLGCEKYLKNEHAILRKLLENNDALKYVVEAGSLETSYTNFVDSSNVFRKEVSVFAMHLYGKDLVNYINDKFFYDNCGFLHLERFVNLVIQLIEAVKFIHSKDVTHKDLKPDNVLYDAHKARWILCDFGFAEQSLVNLTKVCGTVEYIAPEVLKNKPYNSKVDMWGIGCIFYAVLTGRLLRDVVFKDASLDYESTKCMRANNNPLNLEDVERILPKFLYLLIENFLDKNPENRPTAQDALFKIREKFSEFTISTT